MKKTFLAVLTLALLASPLVPAQGRGGPPDPARMAERLARQLDLDEAVSAALVAEMTNHREEMAPLMDRLRRARAELGEQIAADEFDEVAIRDLAADVARLESDIAVARGRHVQDIRGMLTDEQWAEFKELRRARERFGRGPGRGPGGPPGGQYRGR